MSQGFLMANGSGLGWPFVLGVVPFLLLATAWFSVAVFALKGDDVDKPNRMAHVYGYTVCVISLIVALVSLSSILNAAFDRANPLQSEFGFGTSFSSFESYKATYRREQVMFDRSEGAKPDTASEATLRARYEALAKDRVTATRYRTSKSITMGALFLVIAIVLFVTHWRWMRGLNGVQRSAA